MHPLFAHKVRTILYLLAWLPVAGLLMYPLHFSAGLPPVESAAVLLPMCEVYALICLSPWYLCRVLPIGPGQIPKILQSHVAAAVVASLFWIVLRHEVDYRRPLLPGETATARTWVADKAHGAKFERFVRIDGPDGGMCAQARTVWCLMDRAARRPIRVPDRIVAAFL